MIKNPGSSCIEQPLPGFCRCGINSLKFENRTSRNPRPRPIRIIIVFIFIPVYILDYWV